MRVLIVLGLTLGCRPPDPEDVAFEEGCELGYKCGCAARLCAAECGAETCSAEHYAFVDGFDACYGDGLEDLRDAACPP